MNNERPRTMAGEYRDKSKFRMPTALVSESSALEPRRTFSIRAPTGCWLPCRHPRRTTRDAVGRGEAASDRGTNQRAAYHCYRRPRRLPPSSCRGTTRGRTSSPAARTRRSRARIGTTSPSPRGLCHTRILRDGGWRPPLRSATRTRTASFCRSFVGAWDRTSDERRIGSFSRTRRERSTTR